MPTTRRMLSGVAIALFMARRIQAGLAANSRPSSTNRMPTPMRKSANAMDLIGLKPPVLMFFGFSQVYFYPSRGSRRFAPVLFNRAPYGWGAGAAAAAAAAAGGLPEELLKNLK